MIPKTDDERWRALLWQLASYCGPTESLQCSNDATLVQYRYAAAEYGDAGLIVPLYRGRDSRGAWVQVGDSPRRPRRRRRRWSQPDPDAPKRAPRYRLTSVHAGTVYGACRDAVTAWLPSVQEQHANKLAAEAAQQALWRRVGYQITYDTPVHLSYRAEPVNDDDETLGGGTLKVTLGGYHALPLALVRQLCAATDVPPYVEPTAPKAATRIITLED